MKVEVSEKLQDKENQVSNTSYTLAKNKSKKNDDSIAEIRKLLKEVRVDMGKYSKSLKVSLHKTEKINQRKQMTISSP
jgi:proline dehydrogenase